MAVGNPYAISFGRIPKQYIGRDLIVDEIIESLESDIPGEQSFKLTGVRGTGKTVTLTEIEKQMRELDNWIVVGIRSNSRIMESLVAELYNSVGFVTAFVDTQLNLSALGIGLNVSKRSPVASIEFALKEILRCIAEQNKRVLVTIDEVRKTDSLVDFVQEFQILIRQEMPIYLVVAGLYEDIESIENSEGLTFFLRAEKYEMKPLNYTLIRNDYEKTLGVTREVAEDLAIRTKGYPFAYQAIGKYMWDSGQHELSDDVLARVDEALSEKVYKKIWAELTGRDRFFLKFIVTKDRMSVSDLLELTHKKHNEWSEPRKRLSEKGIIDVQVRGQISLKLPRLKEFVENQID